MPMEPANPKISVITAVYNNRSTIRDTLESVLGQTYDHVEYIVIDGESDDGTLEIIEGYEERLDTFVSEPDDGIYSAFNKGVQRSSGDIVGILNADDFYANERVLARVVEAFAETDADCVYGDLVYVDEEDPEKVVRYWESGEYDPERLRNGWMPPHPTFFVRQTLYEQYGGFSKDLDISADYELIIRLLYRHGADAAYIPETLVRMRTGGASNASIGQRLRSHMQDYRAWLKNGFIPNPVRMSLKPLSKIRQYFASPE